MNTYAPPFKLTNTMLDLVASISEKVGRITTGKNLESKPHLRKNNRVKSIYSSLKIEANSLTIGQVRCHRWKACAWRTKGNTRSKERIQSI